MWLATLWRTAFALGNRIRRPRRSTLTTPVRREHTQRPTSVGMRLLLGLAGVAIIAITTSCEPITDHGITNVGTKGERLIAVALETGLIQVYTFYESTDGGITWTLVGQQDETTITWGERSVRTPQGSYGVSGSDVVLVRPSGGSETVYSVPDLTEPINLWVQSQETRRFLHRRLSTGPGQTMAVDAYSGNVVVAMGIQGILVGTPTGQWTAAAVGPFAPTGFSSVQRAKTLLSAFDFLTAALSFSLSMTALAVVIPHLGRPRPVGTSDDLIPQAMGVAVLVAPVAGLLVFLIDSSPMDAIAQIALGVGKGFVTTFAFIAAITAAMAIPKSLWKSLWWAIIGSAIAMMAFLALPFLAWVMAGWPSVFAELASTLSCTAVAIWLAFSLWRRKVHDLAPS